MVRKKDRKKADLKSEATHCHINCKGVECFLLKNNEGYFALNFEINRWVAIPKWAFEKYATEIKKS